MKHRAKHAAKSGPTALPKRRGMASALARIGHEFHARGWALGTSGNYSAVLNTKPLRLLITSSGLDKSALTERDFLEIEDTGAAWVGKGKPSAETFLHLAVAGARKVGCVLHTHSVWSTLLSERFANQGGLTISGYEMLKGLEGVQTHEHSEWIPIFANTQDVRALAEKVSEELKRDSEMHGFLLSGHGLYTWGNNVAQARRHVEIFEFLFEVMGRKEFGPAPNVKENTQR